MREKNVMYVKKIKQKQTKTVPKNFNEKKATYKTQNVYILPAFLLVIIAS